MRLHSIFQEKKLLWSALLPDAIGGCLESQAYYLPKYGESLPLSKVKLFTYSENFFAIAKKQVPRQGAKGQALNYKPGLIQTKDFKTNNLEQKKSQTTSLFNLNEPNINTDHIGVPSKKQAKLSFSSFFSTISNDFILNSQANKIKLQNAGCMGLALASLVPKAIDKMDAPLSHALLHRCKVLALDQKIAKGRIRSTCSPSVQVILVFSSFEKSDLSKALNLFQSYLTSLTNRLTTINNFQTTEKARGSDLLVPRFFALPNSKAVSKIQTKGSFSGKVKTLSDSATWSPVADPLDHTDGHNKSKVNTLPGIELQNCKVAGILRAVRDLNQPLKLTDIPLSTKLYTVIRSPHVFKKTREQFAITKVKRTVQLYFKSKAALRLLIDSLILLKLSAEVKVIIRDLK